MINNKCLNINELKKNEDTWEDIEKRTIEEGEFYLEIANSTRIFILAMKNLTIFLICCFLIFQYPAIYADTLLRVPSSFQSQYQSQGRNNAKNADPPLEVVKILQSAGLVFPEIKSMLWLPYPYKAPQDKPIGSEQLIEVDALELLEPLLDTPELFGTVDFIDLFNSCNTHCDTCLFDSQYPTRMFSHESLDALFKERGL